MVSVRAIAVLGELPLERGVAVVRDGDTTVIGVAPEVVRYADGEAAFALVDEAARGGFWVGYLAYDLGRAVERVRARLRDDLAVPDVVLSRYDARLVLRPGHAPEVHGDGPTGPLLARAAWRARHSDATSTAIPYAGLAEPWTSSLDRTEFGDAIDAIMALLGAGECYQVNLTRRLGVPHATDPIGLFGALQATNPAPHAALCTFGPDAPRVAIVSASPELFLRVDGRTVETRPIKGTANDPDLLATSGKDRAENLMIVDLARNDLGRVCEYGSVTVPSLFTIEAHPGLYHLVSAVRGRLRDDVSLAGLVRATFPPASVTGAPKPRVLQAIEDLEPVRRGVYCGAVGWIDGDAGLAELAVAIRTFTVTDDATYLGVGGGIVADSRTEAEWTETELKASRLLEAATGAPLGAGIR